MADPATESDAPTGRRHRRNERRRRRIRHVVAIVAGVAVLSLFVLLATDAVRFGGGDRPSLAGTAQPVEPDTRPTAPTSSTAIAVRHCRTLSTDDPLRLWVGGDSLAGSLGPALGTIAGATGVVQPYFDSRVSSGLANAGFFDWPGHATDEMTRLDPEIVVFIIGANDWGAVSGDAWKADYAQKVESMMKTLIGSGRTVYWVGSPTLKDEKMDAAIVEVNAVAQDVAKRHREVHYVDAYKLFSDTNGGFSADLADETGKVVTMRAGDGVHLTMDGADYLARNVYQLVDAQCGVTEQKVAGVTKRTIESEGSTQVAPGSGSSSSSGSSGGAIATTPPAPAPTVTNPPVTTTPTTTPPVVTDPPATSTPPTTITIPTLPQT